VSFASGIVYSLQLLEGEILEDRMLTIYVNGMKKFCYAYDNCNVFLAFILKRRADGYAVSIVHAVHHIIFWRERLINHFEITFLIFGTGVSKE